MNMGVFVLRLLVGVLVWLLFCMFGFCLDVSIVLSWASLASRGLLLFRRLLEDL